MSDVAAPRRPWTPLILLLLGLLLYLLGWTITYAPGLVPIMFAIHATMFGPLTCLLLLGVWWLSLGRASRTTRIVSTVLLAVLAVGAVVAAQTDTRFWMVIWGLPAVFAVLTVVLTLLFHAPGGVRVPVAAVLGLAALLPWELIRMEGVTGEFGLDPAWRWSPTAEQRVAAFTEEEDSLPGKGTGRVEALPAQVETGDWPGFRGGNRDGIAVVPVARELVERWRRPVGPGWGSVSGVGERLFTQEQRGDDEVVVCYALATGKPLWTHAARARHTDGPSGPGPRATPTYHEGKLYVQGATGLVQRLDAVSGKPDWETDLKEALDVKAPPFGFSGSPLVVGGKVYLHPGTTGPLLIALDAKTGKLLWKQGEQKEQSYGSPHWSRLAGEDQVLLYAADGLTGHEPQTGKELWRYEWKADPTAQACIQPMLLSGDRIVLGSAQQGKGIVCIKVTRDGDTWKVGQEWDTNRVTPRFNDMVHHDGHVYGLDSGHLFCLDAGNGELKWKGGRGKFGSGQVLLAGGRLVVQAERGGLSLLEPDPSAYPTPTVVEALKDKTWNHPAPVRGHLIVRNGKEMVCYGPKE